ncbi:MAG: aminopeptidase P family protein [Elusimicrobiota bacterium]|jgi:Xaa-Pro aminopeptidase|nr:aminopeptidase P family protein [Elusimicrobiota bacterium]
MQYSNLLDHLQNASRRLKIEHGQDSFLLLSPQELFYIAKANFSGFWFLIIDDKFYVICSQMIKEQLRGHFGNCAEIIEAAYPKTFSQTLVELLNKHEKKSFVLDKASLDVDLYQTIQAALSAQKDAPIEIKLKSGVLKNMRMVKDEQELSLIKQACEIVSQTCQEAVSFVKSNLSKNITELDVHYKILEIFAKYKTEPSFSLIIASGANSANPHHTSSQAAVCANSVLLMDIGCKYLGYCSDLTRTYYIKDDTPNAKVIVDEKEFNEAYLKVQTAQELAIQKARAGVKAADVDFAARNSFGADAKYFIHGLGHGVGIDIHEDPYLAPRAQGKLQEAMVVTVEPGIYFDGKFGIRIEDTVVITKDGCKLLTNAPYKF